MFSVGVPPLPHLSDKVAGNFRFVFVVIGCKVQQTASLLAYVFTSACYMMSFVLGGGSHPNILNTRPLKTGSNCRKSEKVIMIRLFK